MRKKRILVNLYKLKTPNCGLGQVALNYGKYFKEHYVASEAAYELYLLVPSNYVGYFGDEVKYLKATWWRKIFSFLIPRFDVWHASYQLSPFKSCWKSTRIILTIHDLNFMYEKKEEKRKRYLKRMQEEITRAAQVVSISEFTKSEIITHLGHSKEVKVIYNGVENITLKQETMPVQVNASKPFFFSIGQIKEKKNFHTLLPMMKLLPAYNLYIAGQNDTAYAREMEKWIADEKLYNVKLIGAVTESEKVWLYKHCEAFLFPSLFEGFGLPVIEAMWFGKPVFSSTKTSLKEIGGKCAYFWESFDPEEMKELIVTKLPEYIQHSEFVSRNTNYARSFGYDRHMKQYEDLYTQL